MGETSSISMTSVAAGSTQTKAFVFVFCPNMTKGGREGRDLRDVERREIGELGIRGRAPDVAC